MCKFMNKQKEVLFVLFDSGCYGNRTHPLVTAGLLVRDGFHHAF